MNSGDPTEEALRPRPSGDVAGQAGAALDRAIQSRIGEQLRAMYDGLMDQPVPDRFHALLARLEDGEGFGEAG